MSHGSPNPPRPIDAGDGVRTDGWNGRETIESAHVKLHCIVDDAAESTQRADWIPKEVSGLGRVERTMGGGDCRLREGSIEALEGGESRWCAQRGCKPDELLEVSNFACLVAPPQAIESRVHEGKTQGPARSDPKPHLAGFQRRGAVVDDQVGKAQVVSRFEVLRIDADCLFSGVDRGLEPPGAAKRPADVGAAVRVGRIERDYLASREHRLRPACSLDLEELERLPDSDVGRCEFSRPS